MEPDNALILGTALHTGIEEGVDLNIALIVLKIIKNYIDKSAL